MQRFRPQLHTEGDDEDDQSQGLAADGNMHRANMCTVRLRAGRWTTTWTTDVRGESREKRRSSSARIKSTERSTSVGVAIANVMPGMMCCIVPTSDRLHMWAGRIGLVG